MSTPDKKYKHAIHRNEIGKKEINKSQQFFIQYENENKQQQNTNIPLCLKIYRFSVRFI